ncbi:MAG: phosphoribosylformylglycinamidine cyclo-ligase [candidate division WOR-3 bacterium]
MRYKDSGVDTAKGDELVEFLRKLNPDIGGFGGAFPADFLRDYVNPVLVASTDSIGTKVLLGLRTGLLDGLGYDLVGMVVNDIAVMNARPLFFLDYYATGRLDLDMAKRLLSTVVKALSEIDCVLLGGETAELPGLMEDFEIAGFVVGIAERDTMPKKESVKPGMRVLGLRSSGPHSNGYSLIRKVFEDKRIPDDLAKALMAPTTLYVKQCLRAFELGAVAAAHITGGGIPGNLVRVLPNGLGAVVRLPEIPEVFRTIQDQGGIPSEEMASVFNLGWGMLFIAPEAEAEGIIRELGAVDLGWITEGERGVKIDWPGFGGQHGL